MSKNADTLFGYHLSDIPRGEIGELSKVQEELLEALDAERQRNPLMVLQELSDMVGAVQAYLEKHHPSLSLESLTTMAEATKKAFENGRRQ